MADGPLRGARILDLTHVWAGPLATRILADLGARVVKIEAPMGRGPRDYRGGLPIGGWLGGARPAEPWNANAVFVKLQRNKGSVALDLKAPAGRETFLELATVADVVMENFSARAMPDLGLDYEDVAKVNARIVYVSMPGFGKSGPYRDRVAFGPTAESMSGLATVMGYGPEEPRNTTMALMDPIAAVGAAAAVVDALRRRERTGKGMRVELSLHEGGVAFCAPWLVEAQLGSTAARRGNRHPRMAPHGVYPCAGDDEWLAVACRNDADWQALCGLIGGLPPGADLAWRQNHEDRIDAAIAAWTRPHAKQQAAAKMQAAGVPAGPVNTTPDLTADPQVQARGFFVALEPSAGVREGGTPRMKEPSAGVREGERLACETPPRRSEPDFTPMPGNPIKMAGTSSADWTPCPRLGADNRAILKDWLNYDDDRIDALEASGVLVDKPPK